MNTLLLVLGTVILLVVVAAAIQAYVRRNIYRPLAQSRPQRVMHRAPGQLVTDTSLLQDMMENTAKQRNRDT